MSGRATNRSQTALNWVREHSQATGNDRFVLLTFAFYVHRDTGLTYPSVPTIMRETGLGRSRVFAAIQNLEKLGELKKVQRRFNTSSQYEIVGPLYDPSPDGEKSTVADFIPGGVVHNLESEVHTPGLLKSTGATATNTTTTTKTTTTTRDPRFESAVTRAAYHRSLSSWVDNQIAVKVQTAKKLRTAGDEGDALNDWLVKNPDATAEDAGLAYANNEVSGTESYVQRSEVPTPGRTYRYEEGGSGYVPQFRVWSDTLLRWTREEYANAKKSGGWKPDFDADPYDLSWNEELGTYTQACDCTGGCLNGGDADCGQCGGKGWRVAAQ